MLPHIPNNILGHPIATEWVEITSRKWKCDLEISVRDLKKIYTKLKEKWQSGVAELDSERPLSLPEMLFRSSNTYSYSIAVLGLDELHQKEIFASVLVQRELVSVYIEKSRSSPQPCSNEVVMINFPSKPKTVSNFHCIKLFESYYGIEFPRI